MVKYEIFDKVGNRYSLSPRYVCNNPAKVFAALSGWLVDKYLKKSGWSGVKKIERRRCPYCDSFDEIIIYHEMPNGDKTKIVFTVPV